MKLFLIPIFILISLSAHAQVTVYKYKDSFGNTVFTNVDPKNGAEKIKIKSEELNTISTSPETSQLPNPQPPINDSKKEQLKSEQIPPPISIDTLKPENINVNPKKLEEAIKILNQK